MIYTKGWLICSCYPILNLTANEVLGNGYSYKDVYFASKQIYLF